MVNKLYTPSAVIDENFAKWRHFHVRVCVCQSPWCWLCWINVSFTEGNYHHPYTAFYQAVPLESYLHNTASEWVCSGDGYVGQIGWPVLHTPVGLAASWVFHGLIHDNIRNQHSEELQRNAGLSATSRTNSGIISYKSGNVWSRFPWT